MLLLAWNFEDEVLEQQAAYRAVRRQVHRPGARTAACLTARPAASRGREPFYEQLGVPVQSTALLATREEALAFPRGDVVLAFCGACGFVFNEAYDPALQDYSRPSEESQAFSPRFQAFSHELAERLVERYDVRGKDVLEAGCGRGDFLVEICELGGNRGVGIDPGWLPGAARRARVGRVRARAVRRRAGSARGRPRALPPHARAHRAGARVRRAAAPAGRGAGRRGRDRGARRPARARGGRLLGRATTSTARTSRPARSAGLAVRCGLEVLENRLEFDGQYIVLEARPIGAAAESRVDAEDVRTGVRHFAEAAPAAVDGWRDRLASPGRVALWGGSSKAVAFLTAVRRRGRRRRHQPVPAGRVPAGQRACACSRRRSCAPAGPTWSSR